MPFLKSTLLTTLSATLLLLGACSSPDASSTAPSPEPNPAAADSVASTTAEAPSPDATQPEKAADGHGGQGGQVVETGPYHLELVAGKEAEGMHLDFYLQQGDDHTAIPDAKVMGQLQFPDGSQKSIEFIYGADGEHYTAKLPDSAPGTYKLAVQVDINGEKVNGRFTF